MDWREHIAVDPAVLHGKACIRGTRIPVAVVLANLADGLSAEEILKSYPSLRPAGIQAALAYAADLAQERVLPLPAQLPRMRAKLDENVPFEAAELLRAAGWECDTVYDEGLPGADDAHVAAACQAEARVLFTLDLDFADIRTYAPSAYIGIVVLRPHEPSRRQALKLLTRVLPVLSAEWIEHRLWIVEPMRIRVRGANEPAEE